MPVATTVKRAHVRRNWFINPGAEGTDLSQWLQYFGCPRATTTEDKYSGTQSMKYTPNSTTNVQGPICYVTPAAADRPWSGATFRCSLWVKGAAGGRVSVANRCATASTTFEGLQNQHVILTGDWQRLTCTSTMPYASDGRSLEFFQFGIQMPTTSGYQSTQVGVAYYIDNVCIEMHPDGQPFDYDDDYFDGSMAGCRWVGNVNYSYSEKTAPVLIPVGNTRIWRTEPNRTMIRNGFGELGNNTNFTAFVYDAADKPAEDPAVQGSFYATGNGAILVSGDPILLDVNYSYNLSLWARQRVDGDQGRVYTGFTPYDRIGNYIAPSNYMYQAGTTTTLAQNLVNGDTKVYLTSAANWNNATGTSTWNRSFIFWNFVDPYGYTWPQHTYSRSAFQNMYDDGAVDYTENSITLRQAWYLGTFLAGRPVSNGSSGGSFLYTGVPGNAVLPNTWTYYEGVPYTGQHTEGSDANTPKKFPYGTHWIRPVFLLNRSSSTSRHAIAGVKVTTTGPWWVPATITRGGDPAADAQLLGWNFTGTGTSVPDSTGNNRVGTVSDAAMRVSDALSVSASTHRLTFSSDAATRPPICSISCWINVSATGAAGDGFPMHHARAWDSTSFGLWIKRIGSEVEVWAVVRTANNVLVFTAPATGVNQDAWHHLALTYDGVNAYLYINETIKASGAATGDLVWTTDATYHSWQIGNHQHMPTGMTGYQVDDVRLYNRGLTSSEVSELAATRA